MDETIKRSLLAWLSGVLQRSISVSEIQNGSALIQLANLTEDVHFVFPDLTSPASLEAFLNYLDTMFQFRASCLFDIPAVICGSASEEEVFGVCMLILLCCLQSRSRQRFMDAALDLDVDVQSVIFHLVHEPMTELSTDQNLTRECVLAGFRDPPIKEGVTTKMHPSTLTILDAINSEDTPIKSAQVGKDFHQSFRGSNETESIPNGIDQDGNIFRKTWSAGQTVTCNEIVSSSPAPQLVEKLDVLSSSPIFRMPEPVRAKKKASETNTKRERTDRIDPEHLYSEDPSDDDLIDDYRQRQSSSMSYPLSPSSLPPPPPPVVSGDGMPTTAGIRHQRPTDLRLMLTSQSSNCRYSRNTSQSNSLVDLNDISTGQKSHLHPPASPLATLKNLLDSPLWAQKTRLREAEREKRRLLAELEKERTYRDEVENVVTELRNQLDEARQRATEAESRATRLSRDLVAYQDQTDELNMCRTELVMREDEITDLKKRLNSFQDVLNHSRHLELENANLHQECADHKQKIEQLSGKLNEIKDRRMVCTEVETLRSKLRDMEAQLAQQLLERENAEKDARRQQELYSQLKLQQTVQEKRRARNARHTSTGVASKTLGSQLRLSALQSGDEIECEDPTLARAGSKDSVGSSASASSKLKTDSVPLRDGENLGSVLQSELRAAQEESSRLKNQLEETSVRLQKREWEINQLTERVQQLTIDLTSSSTQCELTEQEAEQTRAVLTKLQTDLSTLEGRLIWARTMNEKSMNAIRQSVSTDLIARLENTGILDRIKGIGTGLPDSLNQLCQLFTSNLDDVWALIMDQLSSLQSTMAELRSTVDYLKTALNQKEEDLTRVTNELHDQSKHHAQQLAAGQSELLDVKRQFETLKQTQCTGGQMVNDLQKQVDALMHEKQQFTEDLDRIKEQSTREMCQSKEMLERATQRLRELEEQLEVWNNRESIDVAIQTDTIQGELPLPADVSPLTDSLCRSDMEENERHEADDDPSVVEEQAQVAYEALAADRRGLSDELVRLHDELAESHVDRCELKQQVVDLQEELVNKEIELQRQVALYSRAQEQWVLAEREALNTKNQLAQLRADYASELQALRAELLPHIGRSRSEASATASHIEAARLKYEAERDDLKNKLSKATRDLERLEVDRSRLIELNTSLQRELTETRRWTQNVTQDPSSNMCRTSSVHERQQVARALESALRNQRTPANDPLEDWLEAVTTNNANHHHNRSSRRRKTDSYDGTDLSDSLSGSSRAHELEDEEDPRLIATDTQLVNHKPRSESSQYSRLSIDCKPGLYTRLPKQFRSRTNRRKPKRQMEEIVRQLERLTSTTAELETKAFTMQQNMNVHLQRASAPIASSTLCAMPYSQQQPHTVPTSDPFKAHSVSLGGPMKNGLDQSNAAMENPVSAPVHFPSDPQQSAMPVAQNYDLDTDADSSAFTDLSQVSSASHHGHLNNDQASSSSHQQSPPYSVDLSQMSVPHRSDSAYSSRQTRTTQPPHSLSLFTGMSRRGGEPDLKKPSATKASPVEPDPHRIAELNRRNRLQPMHLRTSYPVETQTVNPEKVATALRQLSSKTQGKEDPGGFRKPNGSVPLTTVPEEYGNVLREMGDENIVNSQSSTRRSDPSTARYGDRGSKSGSQSERSEGAARSAQLAAGYRPIPKHLNSITDALIAASDDPSSMAAALEMELARVALIGSKEETSRQSQNSAATQSPPTVSIRSARGSVHSDKQNSSIAFEILMEPASTKPRLPAPRANSSTIVRRIPGSKSATTVPVPSLSQNGEGLFSSAKLPLASALPTPLQRNSKCLNPQPSGCR